MEVEIEKVVKAQKEAQSAAEVTDREEQFAHNKESRDNEQQASYAKEYVAKVEAELQKICGWTRTSSHRRQGLQDPKAIKKGRSREHPCRREATGSIASQERHESCEAEWCIQEHTQHNVK